MGLYLAPNLRELCLQDSRDPGIEVSTLIALSNIESTSKSDLYRTRHDPVRMNDR